MEEKLMKYVIGLFLLAFAAQPMLAKDDYPLTVRVVSMKNIENRNGSFHMSGSIASWGHVVAEHCIVEASDGNTYELVPENKKDMLLPGTYQAKIQKRDVKVCEPKDNGKCRDVKFKVAAAEPTAAEQTTESKAGEPATK
jgi:hypothetical protein